MKTVFAKDIPFTAKSHRAISPLEYEEKLLKICNEKGWTYRGLVLPTRTPFQNTSVCIEVNGKIKTPYMHVVFSGKFNGKDQSKPPKKKFQYTEEEHLKISSDYFNPIGWDVLGCAEPYKGTTTHLILRCHCHGKVYKKSDLHNARRRGGLTCPVIRSVAQAVQNGEKLVIRNKDAQRPMHLYIILIGDKFFKFGITTRKNPLLRFNEHQKTTNEKLTFHYSHLFTPGWQAGDLETGIKRYIKGKRISRKLFPQGFTETLPISKLEETKRFINDYIANPPAEPRYFYNPFEINPEDYITEDDIDRDFALMQSATLADLTPEDLELDLSPLEAA